MLKVTKFSLVMLLAQVYAMFGGSIASGSNRDFVKKVRPFLKQHCVGCHGAQRSEAGVRLDQLTWDLDDVGSIDDLQNILDEIVVDSMPPAGQPRPAAKAVEEVTAILSKHITKARDKHDSGGGKPVRRLTKTEFVNTIYDLLGVEVDASEIPDDGNIGNFDTLAVDLYTTDMHLRNSLDVAREAVQQFIDRSEELPQARALLKKYRKRFGAQLPDSAAKDVLLDFVTLVNRGRQVDKKTVRDLYEIYRIGRRQQESVAEALVEPMALAMCSIESMFHFETRGKAAKTKYVSPIEMVNRVSYFLWRSAPDAEMIELAHNKQWYESEVREEKYDRMMKDARFERFLNDFTVQWLELDRQDMIAVDDRVFEGFNHDAKASMKEETIQFVSHIINENLPLRNLIESDFMMINDQMAQHYGLEGDFGRAFQKIPVPEGSRRGGLLTQAGILMQTGTGDRTSIVERGAFVARKLLNDPPAPPPPLVGEIPTEGPEAATLTGAQLVRLHRQSRQCAACHKKIDSIGIGMEELDGVGKFRTVDTRLNPQLAKLNKKQRRRRRNLVIELPLETNGSVNGRKFRDIEGLKRALLRSEKQLAEAFVEALVTMAIGRKTGVVDEKMVAKILEKAKKQGYPARTILIDVLQSEAFTVH